MTQFKFAPLGIPITVPAVSSLEEWDQRVGKDGSGVHALNSYHLNKTSSTKTKYIETLVELISKETGVRRGKYEHDKVFVARALGEAEMEPHMFSERAQEIADSLGEGWLPSPTRKAVSAEAVAQAQGVLDSVGGDEQRWQQIRDRFAAVGVNVPDFQATDATLLAQLRRDYTAALEAKNDPFA